VAKYYEHCERNYVMALEVTRGAIQIEDTAALRRREYRLGKRVAGGKMRRLY
jgi:hypothetical protein